MFDSLQSALPYATGVLFLLAILPLLVSMRMFRRSRTDVFWRRRRQAGQRGWRIFVTSFVLLVLSALTCTATLVTGALTDSDSDPTGDTPTAQIVAENLTLEGTSGDTPQATTNVIIPPDRSPTLEWAATIAGEPANGSPATIAPTLPPEVIIITTTPVITPTQTPYPTFTPFATPLTTHVTPGPDAQLTILALDDQISDQYEPVNPRTNFDEGTARIYLFVEFRGMAEGVLWQLDLFHNGELAESNTYLWGGEAEGQDYFFIGNANGYQPGVYEIRVYIDQGENPVSAMRFIVESVS